MVTLENHTFKDGLNTKKLVFKDKEYSNLKVTASGVEYSIVVVDGKLTISAKNQITIIPNAGNVITIV